MKRGNSGIGAPPRSGLVQRKVDTLKNAGKGTVEVPNLAPALQRIVFIEGENLAHPNFSDKYTKIKSPGYLFQQRRKDSIHYTVLVGLRRKKLRLTQPARLSVTPLQP